MLCKQRIDALQVGAGCEHHGSAATCRPGDIAARGHAAGEEAPHQPREPFHALDSSGARQATRDCGMLLAIARRALTGLAVVVGVVTLTFLLLHAAPGDPAEHLLGPQATAEQL